jgi:hypothetical protein
MTIPSTRILLLMVTALMVATAATAATAFAEGQLRKKRIIPDMEQVADPIEQTSQAILKARAMRPAPNSIPPLTPGPDLPPTVN